MPHSSCTAGEKLHKIWKKKLQSFSVISKASYSNFVPGTAFCFCSQHKTGLSFVPAVTHTPAARLPFMQDIYSIVMWYLRAQFKGFDMNPLTLPLAMGLCIAGLLWQDPQQSHKASCNHLSLSCSAVLPCLSPSVC